MSVQRLCSLGFAQTPDLTDTTAYPSLVGFDVAPNKILRCGGRHLMFLETTGFTADLSTKPEAELLVAAQDWVAASGMVPNSAGIAFITNKTSYDDFLVSTVRGLLIGIWVSSVSAQDPKLFIIPFKMASGVLSFGTATLTALSAFTDNNAVKLYAQLNGQVVSWNVRNLSDTILHSGSTNMNTDFNALTGQTLPESGAYVGSHSGLYLGQYTQTEGKLMFIDKLEIYIR